MSQYVDILVTNRNSDIRKGVVIQSYCSGSYIYASLSGLVPYGSFKKIDSNLLDSAIEYAKDARDEAQKEIESSKQMIQYIQGIKDKDLDEIISEIFEYNRTIHEFEDDVKQYDRVIMLLNEYKDMLYSCDIYVGVEAARDEDEEDEESEND